MISCCLVFYLLAAFYLVMLPLIFRLSLSLQRELLFFNDLFRNVSDPLERGLNCTTVMHLDSDGDIKLGK